MECCNSMVRMVPHDTWISLPIQGQRLPDVNAAFENRERLQWHEYW